LSAGAEVLAGSEAFDFDGPVDELSAALLFDAGAGAFDAAFEFDLSMFTEQPVINPVAIKTIKGKLILFIIKETIQQAIAEA